MTCPCTPGHPCEELRQLRYQKDAARRAYDAQPVKENWYRFIEALDLAAGHEQAWQAALQGDDNPRLSLDKERNNGN